MTIFVWAQEETNVNFEHNKTDDLIPQNNEPTFPNHVRLTNTQTINLLAICLEIVGFILLLEHTSTKLLDKLYTRKKFLKIRDKLNSTRDSNDSIQERQTKGRALIYKSFKPNIISMNIVYPEINQMMIDRNFIPTSLYMFMMEEISKKELKNFQFVPISLVIFGLILQGIILF